MLNKIKRLQDCSPFPPGWRFRRNDGEMGRLRSLRSPLFMKDYPSLLKWVAALSFWLFWVAKGAYISYRLTRRYGKNLRQETGIHEVRQFLNQWWWAVWYSIHPREYHSLSLYRKENEARLGQFLFGFETGCYSGVKSGSPEWRIVEDKKEFASFCMKHGLPCVSHRIVGNGADGITVQGILEESRQAPLFLKPVSGSCGKEILVVKTEGDGFVLEDADGLPLRLSRFEAETTLSARFRRQEHLVQPLLGNHRDFQDFRIKGIVTLRIVTLLSKPGGKASYFMAVLQIPQNEKKNTSNQGLFCPIDETTGVLGKGLFPVVMSTFSAIHPASGVMVEGRTVPCWEEAKALALNAHTKLQAFSSLAWDIAITDKGLFLLETNLAWSAGIMQRTFEVPLGETAFPSSVANYLENAAEKQY